jgi:hypothetical protein
MDKNETEVRNSDIEIAKAALKDLKKNQKMLQSTAEWFYGPDDPVRVRMQILEDSISKLTDLLVLEGKLSTSLGWQAARAQESRS